MTTTRALPDGWELYPYLDEDRGLWGVDITRSDGSQYYTGIHGIEFTETLSGAAIYSPRMILPYCSDNLTFTVSIYCKKLSGNAKMSAWCYVWDSADDTLLDAVELVTSSVLIDDYPNATQDGEWKVLSKEIVLGNDITENSSYAQVLIIKPSSTEGNEYSFLIDSVFSTINPAHIEVKYGEITLSNDDAWHHLTHNGTTYHHKELTTDEDEYVYIPIAGTYAIHLSLWDKNGVLSGGHHMDARVGVQDLSGSPATRYYYGTCADSASEYASVSFIVNIAQASRVWAEAKSDQSVVMSNESTSGSTSFYNSYLQIVRIGR